MGFNSKINQKADEILNNKRLEALHNQDRMRSIVYSQFPRLQEIEQQLIIIGSETAKAVLNGGSAVEMTKKLAKESVNYHCDKCGLKHNELFKGIDMEKQ